MIALDKKEDPPYDMKGRVIPFVGNKFILVEIFIIVWKIKILPKPKVELRGNAKNILMKMVPENKEYNISITITDENGLAQALVIIETI